MIGDDGDELSEKLFRTNLRLLSFTLSPLLSCNPLFKQRNLTSHSQTVSRNTIHQLGLKIKPGRPDANKPKTQSL